MLGARHLQGLLALLIAFRFLDLLTVVPLDLLCKLANGELVLVELQVIPQDFWDQRALAYCSSVYCRQLSKGSTWGDLKRVIGINILGGGKEDKRHWPRVKD